MLTKYFHVHIFFFLIFTLLISSTSIFYSNILQYLTFVLFVSSDRIACSARQQFLSQPYLKWSWESTVIKPTPSGSRRSLFRLEFAKSETIYKKWSTFVAEQEGKIGVSTSAGLACGVRMWGSGSSLSRRGSKGTLSFCSCCSYQSATANMLPPRDSLLSTHIHTEKSLN